MIPYLRGGDIRGGINRGGAIRRQRSNEPPLEGPQEDAVSVPVTVPEPRGAQLERLEESTEADGRRADSHRADNAAEAARLVALATFVFVAPRVCKRPKADNRQREDDE